jgi:site-specific DNA recombinase
MKRAAFYCRVSTARQEQEATIESQIAEVEERIKLDGNMLLPNLRFIDDGWSGDLLARPALDEMRDSARKKEFEVLYVYDRGRLARRFTYQEIILDDLSDLDIEFITLHDVNAVTPEEKVLQSMQGVFHEYERIKIIERMRRGKLGKTRNGKLLGYNPLYGFNYIHKTSEQNGYFEINIEEADVVKKIFDWIGNQGYSIRGVIKKLYELQIYPKKRKRDFWTKGPITRLLQNESYIGKHYYYKTEAIIPHNPKNLNGKYKRIKKSSRKNRPKEEWIPYTCPAIIDETLFNKVQEQIKLNQKYSKRNNVHEYLLRGLVKCTCGMPRAGQKGGKQLYYRCADRIYNHPLPARCKEPAINSIVLDKIVWKNLVKLLKNEQILIKEAEKFLSSKQFSYKIKNKATEETETKLLKVDEEENRYLQAFGTGLASFEVYEKQMKDLNNRKQFLQTEIIEQKTVEKQNDFFSNLNVSELCRKAMEKINSWDFSKKELLVRKIIDKVVANQKLAIVKGFIPVDSEDMNVALQTNCSNSENSLSSNLEFGDINVAFKPISRNRRPP